MMEMQASTLHPYYWAPFLVIRQRWIAPSDGPQVPNHQRVRTPFVDKTWVALGPERVTLSRKRIVRARYRESELRQQNADPLDDVLLNH